MGAVVPRAGDASGIAPALMHDAPSAKRTTSGPGFPISDSGEERERGGAPPDPGHSCSLRPRLPGLARERRGKTPALSPHADTPQCACLPAAPSGVEHALLVCSPRLRLHARANRRGGPVRRAPTRRARFSPVGRGQTAPPSRVGALWEGGASR
ncbi:hypothetical protein HYPSUDRAFT_199683 [Hypholoma sublateritium FD-334 SS-4]|uniref:Uncharacterized protein n=1 Tax=Hypholoma sublateritium (strain FD-334 SS-4) TaxID=945553 RepID=A0A0D2PAB5_HYPSF|nr:hypothetical protein HYPSUDRAFT_199683 [Hypholoma sublateritium FD-334 SS-4]